MKFAICNETFQGWKWSDTCAAAASFGYHGIEIAPFTLNADARSITSSQCRGYRAAAQSVGLDIVGLHWLLVSPDGLSITSDDRDVRRNTALYLADLVDLCAELHGHTIVLGSPKQRQLPNRATPQAARRLAAARLEECLAPALKRAPSRDVTICLEPLPGPEADFILTLGEAMEHIRLIDHPNLKTILDIKSASSEAAPISDLIADFRPWIAHVHANDANRRGPGFGDTDFGPIFAALTASRYDGWVSVEVFDYSPDPETIAKLSIQYMRSICYSLEDRMKSKTESKTEGNTADL